MTVIDKTSEAPKRASMGPCVGQSWSRAWIHVSLVLAIVGLILGSAGRAEATPICPGSFRLMNHNVACKPGAWNNENLYKPLTDEARMQEVANNILLEDPDVVTIEEAWSDECKDKLVSALSAVYPSFMHDLTSYGGEGQDSGIMIFSKLPFIEFTKDVAQTSGLFAEPGIAHGQNGPNVKWGEDSLRQIAYHIFGNAECSGVDCMAAKGVAMVRVRDAATCVYDVAFTHTQAHYYLNDSSDMASRQAARTAQMNAIQTVIQASLTSQQMQTDAVFLNGDLNIDGNLAHPGEWFQDFQGISEWQFFFNSVQPFQSPFYACGQAGDAAGTDCIFGSGLKFFTDPGGFEISSADFSQTANASLTDPTVAGDLTFPLDAPDPTEGFRYDYILHNQPVLGATQLGSETMCMQHLRRHFIAPGHPNVSDHLAIIEEVAQRAPHCMPSSNSSLGSLGAQVVPSLAMSTSHAATFGTAAIDPTNTRIAFGGSAQWYVVNDVGSVNIGLTDNGAGKVEYEVYQAADLSRQVPSFHHEGSSWLDTTTTPSSNFAGTKYSFPKPPYFIKVSSKDRTFTGPYRIGFFLNSCTSPLDTCPLNAGRLDSREWPATLVQPSGPATPFFVDKLYYTFYTNDLSTGALPTIKFHVETSDKVALSPGSTTETGVKIFDPTTFNITLPDCPMTTGCNAPIALQAWDPVWSGAPSAKNATAVPGSLPPTSPGVQKKYLLRVGRVLVDPFTMGLRYETDLTMFHGMSVSCQVQEDHYHYDDITLDMSFQTLAVDNACGLLTTGNDLARFQSDGPGGSGALFQIGGLAKFQGRYTSGASVKMCEIDDIDPNDFFAFAGNPILPLSPTTPSDAPTAIISDTGDFDSCDYYYELRYLTTHEDLDQ
jgi:hypothetical protein